MVITPLMAGFEYSRFSNSLIRNIYLTTPSGPHSEACTSLGESDQVLRGTLASKPTFKFLYVEALWTSFLTCFCCCLRRSACYKKRVRRQKLYDEANERLASELSLHTLLRTVRLTDFIAELLELKTHQRVLINKQKKY